MESIQVVIVNVLYYSNFNELFKANYSIKIYSVRFGLIVWFKIIEENDIRRW